MDYATVLRRLEGLNHDITVNVEHFAYEDMMDGQEYIRGVARKGGGETGIGLRVSFPEAMRPLRELVRSLNALTGRILHVFEVIRHPVIVFRFALEMHLPGFRRYSDIVG